MNKIGWILLFFVLLLVVDLIAVYSGNEAIRYFSKSLLMPLLIGFFIFSTKGFTSSLKKWIILALTFSWAGDVLLMFDERDEFFFIAGLVAFLWAHIWYVFFFNGVIKTEKIGSKAFISLPGLIYLSVLTSIIKPSSLGIMKWPVIIYGSILLLMLTGSLYMAFVKRKFVGLFCIAGAALFVISDSILAVNKFTSPIENAGLFVMSAYGIAQLLLTLGAARYITSTSKQ